MSYKPSEKEEEYFAKQEFERRRKIEQEKQAEMEQRERQRLQEMHYMHCPKCGMQLIEIEYKGIVIDKCSGCRGVWLDAGEMEQIIELEHAGLRRLFTIFR